MKYKVTLKCPVCQKDKEWEFTGICSGACRVKASRLAKMGKILNDLGDMIQKSPESPTKELEDPGNLRIPELHYSGPGRILEDTEYSQLGDETQKERVYKSKPFKVGHKKPKSFGTRGGGVFCPKHKRPAIGGVFPCCER